MFGYIIINKPEIRFREFDCYHSYYCGLCRTLKKSFGGAGQMTLSYDMTFLLMLLTGLYEPDDKINYKNRCLFHPFEVHPARTNEYTQYAADVNIILSYYKCLDDWSDERKFTKLIFAHMLKRKFDRIAAQYPQKAKAVYNGLENIHMCEKSGDTDIDKAAGFFGQIMSELFCYRNDEWETIMRQIGFFLGKFIYLIDAYDDIEHDEKTGNYNPFKEIWEKDREHFDDRCEEILKMMISECSKAFEQLPILENVTILRNILYSGVWTRFELTRQKRKSKQKEPNGVKNV